MPAINDALNQVGVDLAVDAASNLIGAIGDYTKQNLAPGDLALANAGMRILAAGTGIGALTPGVVVRGVKGEWESVHYANDLNSHHPKFKFLFKVQFNGFPGGNFSYFVHRCDKPKVRFNHTEVNYYNFRTKVLTSVGFDPLNFTFLDEIGNTVNSFFAMYTAARSNQGNGRASINGGLEYSSTIPYYNGFSDGSTVEIQQIFGNGLATNIFTLINARIDALEFDDLSMELSAGSMMNCTVSYDAITCRTTGPSKLNSWGNTDLYAGGGTSGQANAGSNSVTLPQASSGTGGGIAGEKSFLTTQTASIFDSALKTLSSKLPDSLADLVVPTDIAALAKFNQPGIISSIGDTLSRNIQTTLGSIVSGTNLKFGGTDVSYINENRDRGESPYSNEGKNHVTTFPTPANLLAGNPVDLGNSV